MKTKPTARLLVDASMAAAMLFALAFRITGDFAHEWAGAAALVLFAVHIILNRRWFGGIPKGKYDFRRTLNTAANMALSVAAALVFATGLMSSKHLLGFLELPGSMALRQIHSTAAYWTLVLASAHIGLHWNAIKSKIVPDNPSARRIVHTLCFCLALFGIWAWIERGMYDKLFLGYSFDFWDESFPPVLFFAENLGVMCAVGAASLLALKCGLALKHFKTEKKKRQNIHE